MTEHVRQRKFFLPERVPHAWSVRFAQDGISPQGERCDLALGMVANVAKGDGVVRNDFDHVSIFQRPIFNATWDAHRRCWRDFVARGEEGFTLSPTEENREVVYRCKPFWYRLDMTGAQGPSYVSVSERPLRGYTLAPMFKNGTTYEYRPCFEMGLGEDGKPHSRAGLEPFSGFYGNIMPMARLYDPAARTEKMADWFSDYLLLLVEFATRSLQSVMCGMIKYPFAFKWQKTASDTLAAGFYTTEPAKIDIGSRLCIKYRVVSNKEEKRYCKVVGLGEETEAGYPILLDMDDLEAFFADMESCEIGYGAQLTGSALSHVTNASSGTWGDQPACPFVWRGKENAWGNVTSMICDVLFNNDHPTGMAICHLEDISYYDGTLNEHYVQYEYGKPYMELYKYQSYVVSFGAYGKPYLLVPSELQSTYPEYYWATYTRHLPITHKGVAHLCVGGDITGTNGINHGTYEIIQSPTTTSYGGRLILEEGS